MKISIQKSRTAGFDQPTQLWAGEWFSGRAAEFIAGHLGIAIPKSVPSPNRAWAGGVDYSMPASSTNMVEAEISDDCVAEAIAAWTAKVESARAAVRAEQGIPATFLGAEFARRMQARLA